MNVFKQPTIPKSPYKLILIATLSSIGTSIHTSNELVLDTSHPGIDDNIGRISVLCPIYRCRNREYLYQRYQTYGVTESVHRQYVHV